MMLMLLIGYDNMIFMITTSIAMIVAPSFFNFEKKLILLIILKTDIMKNGYDSIGTNLQII